MFDQTEDEEEEKGNNNNYMIQNEGPDADEFELLDGAMMFEG